MAPRATSLTALGVSWGTFPGALHAPTGVCVCFDLLRQHIKELYKGDFILLEKKKWSLQSI